ncbi:SWIM zinc finger domain protein [Nitzschia inconspicua]|uniref:SWIM zinc finger domain protein n=1 Tax=Nitzschia inconspicua TaxID=303405 RepID=A0A9K3KBQ0_9STRA|nr:SWIM zinc finger domain protein [Nitzschia inconspicua]
MLQQAMVASERYISYRVCERKWWVLYSGHRNLHVRLLPVFARVRTVSIDENYNIKCSCFEYERNGIPCKHVCHLALNFGTSFGSFTHHSVDIRFWTAYSLDAVVLDPSELNENELNIRNKLVTARWKSPQPPTAPASMKSMDEGRYSVGSNLHVETLIKNKLSILNYDIDSVEKAVDCMADFFFVGPGDETLDTTKPVGSHELCDVAGKDKAAKTARDLETLIIALKEEIASEQSPPTGKVVSCMISKASSRKTKHVKQSKYHIVIAEISFSGIFW